MSNPSNTGGGLRTRLLSGNSVVQWSVVLLVGVGILASVLMLVTGNQLWSRIALVACLWGVFLAAVVAFGSRRDADRAVASSQELRLVYDAEIERENAARREFELTTEQAVRSEWDARRNEDLAALRHEVEALRRQLVEVLGTGFIEERVSLRSESYRISAVELPGSRRTTALRRDPAELAGTVGEVTVAAEPVAEREETTTAEAAAVADPAAPGPGVGAAAGDWRPEPRVEARPGVPEAQERVVQEREVRERPLPEREVQESPLPERPLVGPSQPLLRPPAPFSKPQPVEDWTDVFPGAPVPEPAPAPGPGVRSAASGLVVGPAGPEPAPLTSANSAEPIVPGEPIAPAVPLAHHGAHEQGAAAPEATPVTSEADEEAHTGLHGRPDGVPFSELLRRMGGQQETGGRRRRAQ